MPKTLVIVESPAKAKTISRFLGKDYDVQASFGHIRDLPESSDDIPEALKKAKWAKLGVNVENDFEPLYIVPSDKKRHVDNLKKAAKDASHVMLATDEDREGESISWHILEILKPKKGVKVDRIVFHEITPEAIRAAIRSPRQVDQALVRAQETRRILDRLYGYTLSPLLWRKVGPKLSAGRVQSVAVRLVVMRERERRDFVRAQYSGVTARLAAKGGNLDVKLHHVGDQPVADGGSFNPAGELAEAKAYWLKSDEAGPLADRLKEAKPWRVTRVEKKPGRENPPVPFMTSTLQQEANRKLGFTARRTMQIAQNLYEGIDIGSGATGLITYMRTDSLSLAERAVKEARQVIESKYGKEYLPAKPREYKSKAKNAQEAHEAIRPTDLSREPNSIRKYLTDEQYKLYDLIWKRTLACQMNPAEVERTNLDVSVDEGGRGFTFGASGKTILFPGFLRVYVEGSDDPEAELGDRETVLPEVSVGQDLPCSAVTATEHETRPPARYTEASLVRRLEDDGVGRPSTYASIIGTIQDRGYIFKKGNELVPSFTAFAVIGLLEDHFGELVDLGFTARMEDELDQIADGKGDMVSHLKAFYSGEKGLAQEVETRTPDIPFPIIPLGENIVVRIGRNGPFVQRGEGGQGNTASVPEDLPPAELDLEKAQELLAKKGAAAAPLATDSATGQEVFLKSGRFGAYLEQGSEETVRRVTLPPGESSSTLSEQDVANLFSFPRTLGKNDKGDDVVLAIGRYGAYLSAGEQKANVGDWRPSLQMELPAALELLANPPRRGQAARQPVEPMAELGTHPDLAGPVKVMSGRFGPYVTDGATNATIPRGTEPSSLTLAQAVELIKARIAAGPPVKKGRRTSAKAPAKRTTKSKSAPKRKK
jgi:DNA topoisomerase-1